MTSRRVLVLNCGSSSVKYRLFDGGETLAKGITERVTDHEAALRDILAQLDLTGLVAVGHRVVHGGTRFSAPSLVDDELISVVRELIPLAPLHNPANLTGIEVARKLLPEVPQVAVFDTAFHRTMPPEAATYALDTGVAERFGIHRYGFHGTSHGYVSRRTGELIGDPDANVITLHLGNGASVCAVQAGRSVATSMGFTPLPGLVMGTRSGDVDPAIIFHLVRVGGMSLDEVDELLNQRSGLKGLSGVNDMRDVLARAAANDERAKVAFDVYCARIKSYVGAYYAQLGRVDAITFTAGVGENAPLVRAASLSGLERLGIEIDPVRNAAGETFISPDGAEVAVLVVPTEEELEIATQTLAAVG
ncbi:MAG: acetate kinase [Hamadaea sp.]|nr:acetate kinase [Hamadaea sp.]